MHPESVNLYIKVDNPIDYLVQSNSVRNKYLPVLMVSFIGLSFTANRRSVFRTKNSWHAFYCWLAILLEKDQALRSTISVPRFTANCLSLGMFRVRNSLPFICFWKSSKVLFLRTGSLIYSCTNEMVANGNFAGPNGPVAEFLLKSWTKYITKLLSLEQLGLFQNKQQHTKYHLMAYLAKHWISSQLA